MSEIIRKSKLAYQCYNFFKKSELAYNVPLYQKYGIPKKYYSPVSSEDFKHLESPLNIHDEKNSREELPKKTNFNQLDAETQESLLSWSDNGYVILKNYYTSDKVDLINKEIENLISTKKADWKEASRIMFAIHKSKMLHDIGSDPKLIEILNLLLGREVDLFQSINFINASQQRSHSDSVHMSTFPFGNIIAVWIALEDITPENGPLHYYPGSHKLPYIVNGDYNNVGTKFSLGPKTYGDYEDRIQQVIDEEKIEKQTFLAKKGDLLIWHANLLHGGEPLIDKNRTRKSMVFHYYAKDVICFHEITQRPTLKKK